MKYSLRWSRPALDQLAQLWLEAPQLRREINEAALAIDQLLAKDPHERGEERDTNHRVMFVYPLTVNFSIDVEHMVVRVLTVHQIKRRRM